MTAQTKSRTKASIGKTRSAVKPCRAPKYQGKCPRCGRGRLDYNGLLELYCPACGYVAPGGGFS